ncbi:MAG: class I SAM-dependent methyltransferase [Chitinophagaceae bacterium]
MQFPPYTQQPSRQYSGNNKTISEFISGESNNVDDKVVESFGEEWTKFSSFDEAEVDKIGDLYFDILPAEIYSADTSVLDVGCGTGRWTKYLAKRVGLIDAVDPSEAILAADKFLKDFPNVRLTKATSEALPFADNTYDMVMSIGVLHHIPDTQKAMMDCVSKVKRGGYFYTYLYYSLDNRGMIFKSIFWLSNLLRRMISKFPAGVKKITCDILAVIIYMPFILMARFLHAIVLKKIATRIPLSIYRDKSFFIIRNDSLDRFGTPLEQRFSRAQIQDMMSKCGLSDIKFSEAAPYWHAIGKKVI